jgi:serine/threonine-protein kinase
MSQPSDPDRTIDEAPRPEDRTDSFSPLSAFGAASRLEILDQIARGGMGDILRGRDADLGRDVAVKVLREDRRDQAALAQRFMEEARIAGRLQHPGVVPVYALGRLADGRPYFTMKLVKGRTQAELLAERKEPAQDRPRFLAIFEQVCQTLAYAHAHGVIHRDLKPANVMVGAYGEVQVMDWGLAKVLTRDGAAAEEAAQEPAPVVSLIRTPRGEGSDTGEGDSETRAGTVLGTPAYMAPEQARGDVAEIDERSDVFGLGSILCEVLTGKPPFAGPSEAALKRARRSELADAFARLDGSGTDAELVALAKRCLAVDPAARPRDAGETATAVTAYRLSVEQRLRLAEIANAEAKAKATEGRKRRRLLMALAGSVMVTVLCLGGGALWWIGDRAARRAAAEMAAQAALDKAHGLEQQDRWPEALAVLEPMRAQVTGAGQEDLRRRVEQAVADATLVQQIETIRLNRKTWVDGRNFMRGLDADKDYVATFREAGLAKEEDDVAVVAARIGTSAVRPELIGALDDWARTATDPKQMAWILEVARRADPDPWRDRFRDPSAWGDRVRLEVLAKELLTDEKELARQTPQLLDALGASLTAKDGHAVTLLAAAQAHHPADFWLNIDLGSALETASRRSEAVEFYEAALAARPSAKQASFHLGFALQDSRQFDRAILLFKCASERYPQDSMFHYRLVLRHSLIVG